MEALTFTLESDGTTYTFSATRNSQAEGYVVDLTWEGGSLHFGGMEQLAPFVRCLAGFHNALAIQLAENG